MAGDSDIESSTDYFYMDPVNHSTLLGNHLPPEDHLNVGFLYVKSRPVTIDLFDKYQQTYSHPINWYYSI